MENNIKNDLKIDNKEKKELKNQPNAKKLKLNELQDSDSKEDIEEFVFLSSASSFRSFSPFI